MRSVNADLIGRVARRRETSPAPVRARRTARTQPTPQSQVEDLMSGAKVAAGAVPARTLARQSPAIAVWRPETR
jgi:hypothetical protein